jgi:RNA polymerase sigma-70 factor (ECF subfamily)
MFENDQYYIEQCLDGRPDEFRHIVRRYQAVLTAYLAGRIGNRAGIEEAAQEVFVRAYFGLKELKKRESFYPWLIGIASRVAKEQLRNKNLLRAYVDVEHLAEQESREQKSPDDYELQLAIAELPDSYREIILLRFYAEQSCAQIAENLNMPIGTVTKMLSRAYAELRQLLEKQRKDEKEVQK